MNDPQAGRARRPLAPLEPQDCLPLLSSRYIGRLAFVLDDRPQIVPLNYVLHDGDVVVRLGHGRVLDALSTGPPVAFEVDAVDPDYHHGWSVVAHGYAEHVRQPEDLEAVRDLPLRPWAPGERGQYVRIHTTELTGRSLGPTPQKGSR